MKGESPIATSDLLMLRLVAPRWSSALEKQLRALEPGGVLLAGPLPPSPETLYELCRNISRCLPAPPILALEAEWEGTNPLNSVLPPLPSSRALAQKGPRFVRQAGEMAGGALRLLGFNTYFGVTFDLTSGCAEDSSGAGAVPIRGVAPGFSPAHAALPTQSGQVPGGATFNPGQHASTFSADPCAVAECAASFVEGLSRHKILPCAKHFPGFGGAPPAADDELSISGRSMAELWRSDLVPYRKLLPKLPLVMMSTAAYSAYDFDYPRSAVLSSQVIDGLLRQKLGYRGGVVAPQLESTAVRGGLDEGWAAVQSLNAGCDMLLVEREESWQAMWRGIEEALASGEFPRERLEQSVARIQAAKKGWAPQKDSFSKAAWERLVRRYEEFNFDAG